MAAFAQALFSPCAVSTLRSDMAMFSLALMLLAAGAQAEAPKNVTSPENVTALGNLVHCPCGMKCQRRMGKWYDFEVGRSCMCETCSHGNLRGATKAPQQEEKAEDAEELDWDSALLPASNLLYCKCGRNAWGCKICDPPCRRGCRECIDWVQGPIGSGWWCIEERCIPGCN